MNYLSLFSGIGAFESALRNLQIPFNLVGFSEIDKYAVKSYCAIHNISESLNLGDITKIDEKALPSVDFITYGFPCQDISSSGKQQGLFNDDGTKTRSGLFFDALRIIKATQPMVAIAENVKNLTSKKFAEQFKIVLKSLEEAGYNNYWKILNAKDYGIPQNRERVFIVSIRKDIDTGIFEFPEGYPLKLRLKDLLEVTVDEKFYLSDKMIRYLHTISETNRARNNGNVYKPCDINDVSKTREGTRVKDNFIEEVKGIGFSDGVEPVRIGNIYGEQFGTGYAGNVWDKNAIAPTLMTMQGGNRQPMVIEEPKINVIGNYSPSNHDASRIVHPNGLAPTVKENHGTVAAVVESVGVVNPMPDGTCRTIKNQYSQTAIANTVRTGSMGATMVSEKLPDGVPQSEKDQIYEVNESMVRFNGRSQNEVEYPMNLPNGVYKIRKLTPKECFRLMGFKDEEFAKAEAVNSNTQLYKQAGNSIVVDVAEELLCMLFDEDGEFYV